MVITSQETFFILSKYFGQLIQPSRLSCLKEQILHYLRGIGTYHSLVSMLQIYESAGLTSTLLAEVYAPIPDVNMTGENIVLNELEFSSSQKIVHSHGGVGSGKSSLAGVSSKLIKFL